MDVSPEFAAWATTVSAAILGGRKSLNAYAPSMLNRRILVACDAIDSIFEADWQTVAHDFTGRQSWTDLLAATPDIRKRAHHCADLVDAFELRDMALTLVNLWAAVLPAPAPIPTEIDAIRAQLHEALTRLDALGSS